MSRLLLEGVCMRRCTLVQRRGGKSAPDGLIICVLHHLVEASIDLFRYPVMGQPADNQGTTSTDIVKVRKNKRPACKDLINIMMHFIQK